MKYMETAILYKFLQKGYGLLYGKGGMVYLELNGWVVAGDPVTVGIVAGVGILAGTSYAASRERSSAAKDAAQFQREGMDAASAAQLEMFYKSLELGKPYRETGARALPGLESFREGEYAPLDVKAPTEFEELYKIQDEEAIRNLNARLASRGHFDSGAGLGTLSDYYRKSAAERTATGYDLGLQRALMEDERKRGIEARKYGRLLDRVNIGRGAAAQGAGYAMGTGSNLANIYQRGAAGQAQSAYAQGAAKAGFYSDLGQIGAGAIYGYHRYGGKKPPPDPTALLEV